MTQHTHSRLLRRATMLLAITPLIGLLTGCGAAAESEDSVGTASSELNISKFKGWSGPIPWGVINTSPSVNFLGQYNDKIEVFGRGSDNALWHTSGQTSNDGQSWSWAPVWDSLGSPVVNGVTYPLLGKGASTTWAVNRSIGSAVAARVSIGGLSQVFVRFSLGGVYSAWSQVSYGNLERDPAMAFSYPYLFVFAPGTDHQFYYSKVDIGTQNYNPANWTGWQVIPGGNLTSEAGAAVAGAKIFIASRGTNNQYFLNQSANNGATWSGWTGAGSGSTFDSGPALTATFSGGVATLNVFGTASSSNGVHPMLNSTSTDGGATWGTFQSVGGDLLYGPAAIAASPTHIETFGVATNNQVYQNTYLE